MEKEDKEEEEQEEEGGRVEEEEEALMTKLLPTSFFPCWLSHQQSFSRDCQLLPLGKWFPSLFAVTFWYLA